MTLVHKFSPQNTLLDSHSVMIHFILTLTPCCIVMFDFPTSHGSKNNVIIHTHMHNIPTVQ